VLAYVPVVDPPADTAADALQPLADTAADLPRPPAGTTADAPRPLAEGAADQFQPLVDTVLDAMQRRHTPGVAIGLLIDGNEYTAGFGVTSVEHPLPVDADTLLQIGSITKTFTALAAMRLAETGTLDLDHPVRHYLPDLRLSDPDVAERVTLRHLFTHTAGFVGDDFRDPGDGDDALARYVTGMADLPHITPLGEVWSYCNSGFCLAGRVIEVATGKPFESALQELVLLPLGMENTFFFPAEVMTHRFAVGHLYDNDELRVARPWPIPRASNAAGGISSTVRDLLRYARFLLGDGRSANGSRLLSAEGLQAMFTPRVPAGNFAEHTAVAWHTRTVVGPASSASGTRIVEHGGATHGQTATLQLIPERNFALVILTNGNDAHPAISRRIRKHFLDLDEPRRDPLPLPVDDLAPFVGRYEAQLTTVELSLPDDPLSLQDHALSPRDGVLVAQVISKGGFPTRDSPPRPTPPPIRVAFFAEDRIVALDPPLAPMPAEFLRAADGRIAYLRWGGRIHARQP